MNKSQLFLITSLIVFGLSSCKKNEVNLTVTPVSVGDNNILHKILFRNSLTGYACGGLRNQTGSIYKTIDGGQSWQTIYHVTGISIYAVYFVNDTLGFASGDNCTILKTTNAGSSWAPFHFAIAPDPAFLSPLRAIYFTDTQNGYIAGGNSYQNGLSYSSNDGGDSWIYSTYPRELRDLYYSTTQNGLLLGYGGILKTTDAQLTTTATYATGDFFTAVSVAPNGTVYAAGYNGGIYKSSNSGENWSKVFSSNCNFNGLLFLDNSIGYAVGNSGAAVFTQDGGNSWKYIKPFTSDNLFGIALQAPGKLFVTAENGMIYIVNI